ncbi:SufS family cysteine desulfurase [Blochmannia endosymbiont of Camponotus (Colobopsis) obliquus]|uniref:SufS family cysteine desulfurase n=1 Tax=Blochmannia endosymbiont of Camponotus (Colobopsis) obliquus TaxID=1505597 RepID=UPI00061A79C6|nr:SufS family cysteine desulfurase [Blochmannia endosymbiont of Camponotus (Colobopsis) obliquus]AKC60525.1 cysteine desulfurase [Blochmannia endosymbiont of Camponotus (Colobopsis) obliquus]
MIYPITQIRSDFPIINKLINNQQFTYLDSAASAQKPNVVIKCLNNFYSHEYATAHRGIYSLSRQATICMEEVREQIAKFINASSLEEIIFTKSTTEGINLIANSCGEKYLKAGDNILITEMEHHSNIVPWQILAKKKQLIIKYIPLTYDGKLDISFLPKLIDQRTQLVAITQLSNVIGTLNPLSSIINQIRKIKNILILVDGAQGIAHSKIDVQKIDCDFYVFSGHKIYGPTGIGILYGKKKLLDNMPPWEVGGGMIQEVNLTKGTTFLDAPWKFEAGTANITGILGLGEAVKYINTVGLDLIFNHENELMQYVIKHLREIPDIIIYGPTDRVGVIAFNIGKLHSYDIGIFLDQNAIAIRTGHHCAMPLMNFFNVSSMCRVSLAMYNNKDDIDRLINGLLKTQDLLNKKTLLR